MSYLIKLLSVICVFAYTCSKNIILFDCVLEPSTINCKQGYASINQTIVLTCLVNYSKDESISHVEFLIVKGYNVKDRPLHKFDIKSKCNSTKNSTECVNVGPNAINITTKFNASKENSGATIYAHLFGEDPRDSAKSNKITLPEITVNNSECYVTTDNNGTTKDTSRFFYLIIPCVLIIGLSALICYYFLCRKRQKPTPNKEEKLNGPIKLFHEPERKGYNLYPGKKAKQVRDLFKKDKDTKVEETNMVENRDE